MQSTDERQQLLKRYGGDQPAPLTAVLKCAAGILTLVAVAAGPWLVLSAGSGASVDGHLAYGSARGFPNSMAESRRVWEERRQRHQGESTDINSVRALSQQCPAVQTGILRASGGTSC